MSQEDIRETARLTLKIGDVEYPIETTRDQAEKMAMSLYSAPAGEARITLVDEAGAELGVVGTLYDSEA
jgi:hypothetical protein